MVSILPAWWSETPYPKTKRGVDLLNSQLVLDPERTPEETKFAGMKMVYVKLVNERAQPKNWLVYKVMMTERDITTAIDCMEQKKTFTFAEKEGDKFPHVELFRE